MAIYKLELSIRLKNRRLCYGSGGCHKKVGVRSLDFLYYRKMLSTKKVDPSLPDLAWHAWPTS